MKRQLLCACCLVAAILGIRQATAAETSAYLPMGRSWVTELDALPRPCGFAVNYYYQRQGYDIKELKITPDVLSDDQSNTKVHNRVNEVNVKLDTWLFPFLNVFLMVGRVEENSKARDVNIDQAKIGGFLQSLPDAAKQGIDPSKLTAFELDDDGMLYGGGLTVAYGIKRVWASVTAAESYAVLNNEDSWINAVVVSPRLGYRFDTPWNSKGANIWIGAMYQKADEEHQGKFAVPGIGDVPYKVKVEEKEPWNLLAGVNADIYGRLSVEIEAGGIMDRQQVLTALTYRF